MENISQANRSEPEDFENGTSRSFLTSCMASAAKNLTVYDIIMEVLTGLVALTSIPINSLIYAGFCLRRNLRTLPCALIIWHVMVPSDLIVAATIPLVLVQDICHPYWPFSVPFCEHGYIFVQLLGLTASKWSVALVAIERLVAIAWPLQHRRLLTRRREIGVIVGFWAVMGLGHFVEQIVWPLAINYIPTAPPNKCYGFARSIPAVLLLHKTLVWYVPFTLTVLSYVCLLGAIHRALSVGGMGTALSNFSPEELVKRSANIVKTFRIISLVVLAFGICWMPFQIAEIYYNFGGQITFGRFNLFKFVNGLIYFNILINPIAYFLSDPKYRETIRSLFIKS